MRWRLVAIYLFSAQQGSPRILRLARFIFLMDVICPVDVGAFRHVLYHAKIRHPLHLRRALHHLLHYRVRAARNRDLGGWIAPLEPSAKDWVLGIAVGLLMAIGTLALFAAIRRGKASIVTPLTALYPLITVILAVMFLNEHFDAMKLAAIAIALMAGVALSKEGDAQPAAEASP